MNVARVNRWQRERQAALHEAFRLAERVMAAGDSLASALDDARAKLQGTILSNGRYLRCSTATLQRRWYDWVEGGRSVDALALDYKGHGAEVPSELVIEFQRRCTLPGVLNVSAAIHSLRRDWEAHDVELPGLGSRRTWCRDHGLPDDAAPDFPFSTRTLYRWQPARGERAAGVHGIAKMRATSSYVDMDYSKLRRCELYTLDDVRLDIMCIDESTGRAVEVICYLLMEVASRSIVAYLLKPAAAIRREDVQELLAYGLQVPGYGIGVGYTTHIKFERGTVTCSKEAAMFLEGASEGRLKIHWTSMDGGIRWVGAPRDKATGHAAGKAVIESFNRRLHIALMTLPGQRGNRFDAQPANLGLESTKKAPAPGSLIAEAERLAAFEIQGRRRLHLNLGMLYLRDLHAAVRDAIDHHNNEAGHDYAGHGTFEEAEVAPGLWQEAT
jgi:hypothetical protein